MAVDTHVLCEKLMYPYLIESSLLPEVAERETAKSRRGHSLAGCSVPSSAKWEGTDNSGAWKGISQSYALLRSTHGA